MYGLTWNILFAWLMAGRVIWNNSGSALAAASASGCQAETTQTGSATSMEVDIFVMTQWWSLPEKHPQPTYFST